MSQLPQSPPNSGSPNTLPFIDLQGQLAQIRPQIEAAIKRVLDHGKFIMGPEVAQLEQQLSDYTQVKHVITCSSGTDALLMVLMAKGVGPGDAVLLPSFTFPATPEVVALLGATPLFVDVDPRTYNLDPKQIPATLALAAQHGLKPRGMIAVDLFGQPADYVALTALAEQYGLWILADSAQSFGASLQGKPVGQWGMATATSFFPAKPLGCYGDGGAIFTNDDELATHLRSIRVHGKGQHKYDNVRIGLNARLDTLQAAILLEKLKIFAAECELRNQIANYYTQHLDPSIIPPYLLPEATSSWAQYTVQLPAELDRAAVMQALKAQGIPTMIYYPRPLHQQSAYRQADIEYHLPVCEALASVVLSLPLTATAHVQVAEQLNAQLCQVAYES